MENCYFIVKKVIVQGLDQLYEADFEEGLNIIWGDLDSGKSTLLLLIDYCLGGKEDYLDYDEIKAKGRVAYLEADLNGSITTFERVLHHSDSEIKVYSKSFDQKDTVYPKICSPNTTTIQPDGWISDLILEKLEIPKVSIKESKIRDDADSYRLSFRDLMKLIFLKQTKVASENLMDAVNPKLLNKNVEIQKFIYGVHDEQLPTLHSDLKANTVALETLKTKTENIRDFLKSTESLGSNFEELDELRSNLTNIDGEISALTKKESYANLISEECSNQLSELKGQLERLNRKHEEIGEKLADIFKLKATYEHDLQCIKSSKSLKKHNLNHRLRPDFDCPLCNSKVTLDSVPLEEAEIEKEERSIKNRIQGCKDSIDKLTLEQDKIKEDADILNRILFNLRQEFDSRNIGQISPLVDSIRTLNDSKKFLYGQISTLEKNIKLNNKLKETTDEIEHKAKSIVSLKEKIKNIEKNLTDISDIFEKLTSEFKLLMSKSKLSNNYGASIDKRFLPEFRERPYSKISSGGVRTIMSVNLFISRLRFLIKYGGHLPTTLMLDTPGQNIGRYARASNEEEDLSDPAIYEEIYKQIIQIKELADKHRKKHQIIVVDNDLAISLNKEDFHLVKRFDKSDPNFEDGFIFDAKRN